MREIKFRAWNKLAKCMAIVDMLDFMFDAYRAHRIEGPLSGSGHLTDIVLLQFTGLHDKNGREVYEGDIIKSTTLYNDTQYAQVLWDETMSLSSWDSSETWMLHFLSGVKCTLYPFCKYRNSDTIEVIGNIYENPEMMEGKQ